MTGADMPKGEAAPDDHERALALSYAPAPARPPMAALLALDDSLRSILRTTREPVVGQMRLAWWHEALIALDGSPPPAEPVLRALTEDVLPRGVSGGMLAGMIDGWEVLLGDTSLSDEQLGSFAAERGGRFFAACAIVLGASDSGIAVAGEGWALADLSRHLSDSGAAARAAAMADERLTVAMDGRWSRAARPLGAMALLARADLAGIPPGSTRRVGRLLWHRITGR